MYDDDTLDDASFISRSLQDIEDRFQRPLSERQAPQRLELAKKAGALVCLLARCNNTECVQHETSQPLQIFPPYLPFLTRLLDGPDDEVNVAVRRCCYETFNKSLAHHGILETVDGAAIADIIFRGISSQDRSTRLCSGKSLQAFLSCLASQKDARKDIQGVFSRLHQCLDQGPMFMKETLLLSIGSLGRIKDSEILGRVICLLIAQLGRPNPVIKGTAYLQMFALAKHYKKAHYSLIVPYMDQVAPFVVSRIATQPVLLAEVCRFLSLGPSDFVATTLHQTLPTIFAKCDLKALKMIAEDRETKPSALFMRYPNEILAHVFLQESVSQTNGSLSFIAKVLSDSTQNATITFHSIVKSYCARVVAELVVRLGDESLAVVNQVGERDLGSFLKSHMLGLITVLNEMLQDVFGKKSLATKRKILRGLGMLVSYIGPSISNVAPQIMATFQTMVGFSELAEVTLRSWYTFLTTLEKKEVGPHVGPTSAAFVASWPIFSEFARALAKKSLEFIIFEAAGKLGRHLDDIVDLSPISDLAMISDHLEDLRKEQNKDSRTQLLRILDRSSSNNLAVAVQFLAELKLSLSGRHHDIVRELASGDVFDPLIGKILAALLAAACRDGDGTEPLRLLAYECIGILGAVDPDRCEILVNGSRMVVLSNFANEEESFSFAMHLIKDLLVGAFKSTSDISYQGHLAYGIQELLKFCQFTPNLVGQTQAPPVRVRNRWNSFPKHVLETVIPLLESKYTLSLPSSHAVQHPIYQHQTTFREWIQIWTAHLITKASGQTASTIFGAFRSAVRHRDVVVAHHLLPHIVLNILISGHQDDATTIREEILTVLEDQIASDSTATPDKKLLSAQAVFMLLDHLNNWVRMVRQDINTKKVESKRVRANQIQNQTEEHLLRVDSILSSIDQRLMARAALQCKAFARSLMGFEQQIVALRGRKVTASQTKDLQEFYERLHEIYAHLDEPDGMEGVSTLIISPSLEHQIRQHESTGRWTSAQSCWEVRLQQSPDNVDFHLGLLRCLRNLGHYDTLRTHVRGVLTRHPEWEQPLSGFQVESAWMMGAWDDVQHIAERSKSDQTPQVVIARVLLAMRDGDDKAIADQISAARVVLGAPISAGGARGYLRSYEAVLDLHIVHELELIFNVTKDLAGFQGSSQRRREVLDKLTRTLDSRLHSVLPTFRMQEPILSIRRTAFGLASASQGAILKEVARCWLTSAKIARKANQQQTAYSAVLQARQNGSRSTFIQSAKLLKATGEPLRALQELENSMRFLGLLNDNHVDLTENEDETKTLKAKKLMLRQAFVLRSRWMNESERYEPKNLYEAFATASAIQTSWEGGHFHLGQFHDSCYKDLSKADKGNRGYRMNHATVRAFAKAIKHGSKYIYQTVPRLLTIWLDCGEDTAGLQMPGNKEYFQKLNDTVSKAIIEIPAYKWYTAFPQIVSRIGHTNPEVFKHLTVLIIRVLETYPKQALWLFMSVVKSNNKSRGTRGKNMLEQIRNHPKNAQTALAGLVRDSGAMANELLNLCDFPIPESKNTLSMNKEFPKLASLGRSSLIIPLQESLTATMPPFSPTESESSNHQPFPTDAPTFQGFYDEVDIMKSLARPRKITIRGSNGQVYSFLGKPKDDLRKDARLMEFNSIINKLLKANSESRRRQLHIRTYGVVALNEECGFIQWVPNTIPVRPVLIKSYDARRVRTWSPEATATVNKLKELKDAEAASHFTNVVLPMFPPVFHEWFLETFPEPTAWLASRLAYGRTGAVMCMVGFILGLGDRHNENILLDMNTGDVVHVDFNCLFDKGKQLDTPERVPFRLTQNLVDGLGVTGVEGVFRIACEVTMQLLRDNKDTLMSVLDAFIHDPLVEWEDEKRRMERDPHRMRYGNQKSSVDMRNLAKDALNPIEKKLDGIYSTSKEKDRKEKAVSTSNLVQMLIEEATDATNLARMYIGWAPWH
ncbi:hypothetical protein BDN72DRAFT_869695 [Pluteus cervinus]|uniref:Uncharacterized protein n=1 Tax=Pluteus cervinus TaxID=181527 RepID=A0ACD3B1P0_9AGAR|nr:hypothetical protein BDN72DRAFT_869695 [Pluteus cervinus]